MTLTRPLKIVHIILSSGFAGSERSTAESCNEQAKSHNVTLIVKRGHRKNKKSIVDHIDKKVHVIEVSGGIFGFWSVSKHIKSLAADIVHCHLRRSTRYLSKIETQAKKVSTLHIQINGLEFLLMDGLVCNAIWQVEQVPSDFKGRVLKANNSLVPAHKISPSERAQLRSELGCGSNEIVIGAVGRYHESKAWDTLIKGVHGVDFKKPIKLLFFGSGRLESKLQQLASGDERIQFIGYRSDIKNIYQALDLCVCPSRFEPLPRVMLEAMDAGTPVLASDIGGCKELIDDYGGYLFKVDNTQDLKLNLQIAITDLPRRHFPELSAHYIENSNARLERFYFDLLN